MRNRITHGIVSAFAFLAMGAMYMSAVRAEEATSSSRGIAIGPFEKSSAADHQARIQEALDGAGEGRRVFTFAPGTYVLNDPAGVRVPSDSTLAMLGARFVLAKSMENDGQAFLVEDASKVTIQGGEVVGQRDAWGPGVNIAGLRVRGKAGDIHITDTTFSNLSSNAVGVFGSDDENPIRNVTLHHVVGVNCCNFYGDYLQGDAGPARGSDRRDQGTVACYHVEGWLVDGCRFERSQSDGTHFYRCRDGQFVNSVVAESQMGGYFLEGCEQVVASGNRFNRNGSRGVTIERDSLFCTLQNNLIAFSGREGLWAPDASGLVVTGNIFRENGQKDDAEKDCEIRIEDTPKFATDSSDIRVENNLFRTQDHQTAAVYLGVGAKGIVVDENTFSGSAPNVYSAP